MATSTSDYISTLNGLIETCKDGEEGFRKAAEDVKDASLRTVFQEYSQQRARFSNQLQQEVSRLGGKPEHSGHLAASLHRGWIDVKSAVTGRDDHAILEECERGEDAAVKNYRQALAEALPSELQSVLQSQYSEVQKAHDHVKSLRDQRR